MIFRRARLAPVQPQEESDSLPYRPPWPDMPPRPPQLQPPAFPFSARGAMSGPVDEKFDPCGAGPIKAGEQA